MIKKNVSDPPTRVNLNHDKPMIVPVFCMLSLVTASTITLSAIGQHSETRCEMDSFWVKKLPRNHSISVDIIFANSYSTEQPVSII